MPTDIPPSQLAEHLAVRTWLALRPDLPPRRLQAWVKGGERKPAVFRLTLRDPERPAVFAKRAPAGSLTVEREVHERILPRLSIASPRCLGFHEGGTFDWMFVEDVGGRTVRPRLRRETRLAGRWLGVMNVEAALHGLGARLPDGGPARYLAHLRSARERIRSNHANPGLSREDVTVLDAVLRQLDHVESVWGRIERASVGIPPTLVHGDFQTKNLLVREREGEPELIPIDWEMAGWGVPVVDLADAPTPKVRNQVDLEAYRSAVADRWPHLGLEDLARLRACGHLLRRLAAVDWITTHLRFPKPVYLVKPMEKLRFYRLDVAEAIEEVRPWIGLTSSRIGPRRSRTHTSPGSPADARGRLE